MSSDRWQWAQKAQELRFHQLDAARKQAETWRTGLTGLTALLGAVLIVKGRDSVNGLRQPYPLVVVALLGLALIALVVATLIALRSASGMPGDECLLTAEDLEAWTRNEVAAIYQAIRTARWLTLVGICVAAVAVGVTWLAPMRQADEPMVVVESGGTAVCGRLAAVSNGSAVVHDRGQYRIIPLATVTRFESTTRCP